MNFYKIQYLRIRLTLNYNKKRKIYKMPIIFFLKLVLNKIHKINNYLINNKHSNPYTFRLLFEFLRSIINLIINLYHVYVQSGNKNICLSLTSIVPVRIVRIVIRLFCDNS